jgi:predicted lipid-binding transport protein (Tim44 family)
MVGTSCALIACGMLIFASGGVLLFAKAGYSGFAGGAAGFGLFILFAWVASLIGEASRKFSKRSGRPPDDNSTISPAQPLDE